jgi:hypothetical protein
MSRAILVLALMLAAAPALADDAKAPKALPGCGKTAEECQRVVDQVTATVMKQNAQLSIYRQLLSEANDRVVANAGR